MLTANDNVCFSFTERRKKSATKAFVPPFAENGRGEPDSGDNNPYSKRIMDLEKRNYGVPVSSTVSVVKQEQPVSTKPPPPKKSKASIFDDDDDD